MDEVRAEPRDRWQWRRGSLLPPPSPSPRTTSPTDLCGQNLYRHASTPQMAAVLNFGVDLGPTTGPTASLTSSDSTGSSGNRRRRRLAHDTVSPTIAEPEAPRSLSHSTRRTPARARHRRRRPRTPPKACRVSHPPLVGSAGMIPALIAPILRYAILFLDRRKRGFTPPPASSPWDPVYSDAGRYPVTSPCLLFGLSYCSYRMAKRYACAMHRQPTRRRLRKGRFVLRLYLYSLEN